MAPLARNSLVVKVHKHHENGSQLSEKIESAKVPNTNGSPEPELFLDKVVKGIRDQKHLSSRIKAKVAAWAKEIGKRDSLPTSRNLNDKISIWTHNTLGTQTSVAELDEGLLDLRTKQVVQANQKATEAGGKEGIAAPMVLSPQDYVKFLNEVLESDGADEKTETEKPTSWWTSSK